MTKEEEAIEILNKFKNNEMQRDKLEISRYGGWKIGDIYKHLELNPAIETVLNMLKEKDKQINSKNGAINALQCALKERTEERDRKDNIVTKQNKIIDLMAEYITYCFSEDEGICKKSASRINNQDYDCDNNCKGCIKQYFEKLAKEKGE